VDLTKEIHKRALHRRRYELIDNFAAALSAARKPAQVLSEVTFLLPASVIRILGRQSGERRQPSYLPRAPGESPTAECRR
jgi:hypothetical protein